MKFQEIKSMETEHIMPTYARFPIALESGNGAVAVSAEGKKYIDFTAGIGVNVLGFTDKGLNNALQDQMGKLLHVSNLYYNPAQIKLAGLLCEKSGLDRVFLCNSGAEANECAIKLARKYSYDQYGEGRSDILTLYNSFHGRTITTLAATGQEQFHQYFYPFTEGFIYTEPNDIEDFQKKLTPSVCAVMLEPVLGEGGVIPLNAEYLKEVRALCTENNILLILDEVQTGVARTGSLYAYEQSGILPDVLTSAKGLGGGLPIGACLAMEKYGAVLHAGTHGTTFGGNPLACAGAYYILETVSKPEFLQAVRSKGQYLREKISRMPLVKEVRGKGMMLGIVLEKGDAKEIALTCHEKGLLILTAKTLLRLLPPLNISQREIDEGLEILENVLKDYSVHS